MDKLSGKSFIITGASSGIGLATLRLFVSQGAFVTAFGRDKQKLTQAVQDIETERLALVVGDMSNPEDVQRVVKVALQNSKTLDGIVNAAGVDLHLEFEQTSLEQWRHVMAVNLDGPFMLCQAGWSALRAGGGSIVNIASGAALRPHALRPAYSASKAGLLALGKSLALAGAQYNIRVNTICPGLVDTPMLRKSWENEADPQKAYKNLVSNNALGRAGTVEELAASVFFLVSDEAAFITGSTMTVDGGRALH